jgi:hypothetical protein
LGCGCGVCSRDAGVIQLVECQLPKLDVAGSSPVARSARNAQSYIMLLEWRPCSTGPPFALQWLSGG